MRFSTRRAKLFAALLALASLVKPGMSFAQSADSSSSLAGATRIDVNAEAWLSPGPSHYLSVSGDLAKFVNEHWQLGIAPAFSVSRDVLGTSAGVGLSGTANYLLGAGRTRWYIGATAGASGGSGGAGTGYVEAHLGALYFLVPTAALRAELKSAARRGFDNTYTSNGAFLTLDSYLPARDTGATSAPDRGALDVAFDASMQFNGSRARSVALTLAPFLTRWAQVGGTYSAVSFPRDGDWPTSQQFRGFARLYAPLGPRAMPYVEGFAEGGHYPYNAEAPTVLGAAAGVRHYLNNGTAFDAGLQWRRSRAESTNGVTIPGRDYVVLRAGIVTELRLRSAGQ